MECVKFYSPYFNAKLESTGRIIRESGNYLTIVVESGFLAGKTTDITKDRVIAEAKPLLTKEQRIEAGKLLESGNTVRQLAHKYNLCYRQMLNAIRTE